MNTTPHFSSSTDQWETPQDFFDALNTVFNFERDVCALPENAKCAKYYSPAEDGLKQPWSGVIWLNPPYGKTIRLWMEKAAAAARNGATVVCLVPVRTDTVWWQTYCAKASEIVYIEGRLCFGNSKNSAPFPSAIVVFRPSIIDALAKLAADKQEARRQQRRSKEVVA